MTLSCFPQNSCYLWGLGAMNTQNWKFFLAQNWCNVAQNGPKIDPSVFLRKSIQYLFHVFGMKLENQGYSKILCIYWFLFEVLNYPAKSGLKKDLFLSFCMTLGNYLKLFGTMITQIYWIFFLSNLFAQNRGKSDPKMTCWTLVKVGETGNLRLENGLFTFWRSVKVAVPVVGPGHCRSPQQVPSRFIKKSSLKLYCLK